MALVPFPVHLTITSEGHLELNNPILSNADGSPFIYWSSRGGDPAVAQDATSTPDTAASAATPPVAIAQEATSTPSVAASGATPAGPAGPVVGSLGLTPGQELTVDVKYLSSDGRFALLFLYTRTRRHCNGQRFWRPRRSNGPILAARCNIRKRQMGQGRTWRRSIPRRWSSGFSPGMTKSPPTTTPIPASTRAGVARRHKPVISPSSSGSPRRISAVPRRSAQAVPIRDGSYAAIGRLATTRIMGLTAKRPLSHGTCFHCSLKVESARRSRIHQYRGRSYKYPNLWAAAASSCRKSGWATAMRACVRWRMVLPCRQATPYSVTTMWTSLRVVTTPAPS